MYRYNYYFEVGHKNRTESSEVYTQLMWFTLRKWGVTGKPLLKNISLSTSMKEK